MTTLHYEITFKDQIAHYTSIWYYTGCP